MTFRPFPSWAALLDYLREMDFVYFQMPDGRVLARAEVLSDDRVRVTALGCECVVGDGEIDRFSEGA